MEHHVRSCGDTFSIARQGSSAGATRRMAIALRLSLVVILLHVSLGLAFAQFAELSGVVRDGQAQIVTNAVVQLTNRATGISRSTRTNEGGVYVFASIKPGTYTLDVEAPGFAPLTRTDVVLNVEQRAALDLTLDVAGRTETVEVTAPASLGTTDGSVATVLDRRFAATLPISGRSFSGLVALTPGVNRLPGQQPGSSGSEFSVNGARDTSNTLTVDGVSGLAELDTGGLVNGAGQRFSSTIVGTVNGGVSMDAVQEVRIQTSTFAAEFGRTPGAQISLVTRSGSNRLNGSAFEQFRNDALMANSWFGASRGLAKPRFDEHEFGATLGGPIVRNRLFFFASFEGLKVNQPHVVNANVPSLEARQQPGPLHDLLNLYPLPTGPARADLSAELIANYHMKSSGDTLGVRLDHAVSSAVQVFGRYARVPSDIFDDSPLTAARTQHKRAQTVTGGMTAALGSKLLADVRVNYGDSDFGYAADSGATFRGWFPAGVSASTLLSLQINGLSSLWDGVVIDNVQRQASVVGSLSYVGGTHHLKVGADYRRLHPTDYGWQSVSAAFSNLAQALAGQTVSTVNVSSNFHIDAVYQNISTYAQDTWKALPRLSMTYGVRWDVNPPPSYGAGQGPLAATTFAPVSQISLSSTQNVPLWKTNYDNISPRFGFS
jgi:hypothetical protein